MKTTVELPEKLMRTAKKKATARGQSFPEFVADAVADRIRRPASLKSNPKAEAKPWMKMAGAFKKYPEELERIDRLIEEEFGKVNLDDWK